jgi:hypothetical protein
MLMKVMITFVVLVITFVAVL